MNGSYHTILAWAREFLNVVTTQARLDATMG